MKTKTIKLADWADEKANYQVKQLTNSTFYRVGQVLTRKEVNELCASNRWTVTIVENRK